MAVHKSAGRLGLEDVAVSAGGQRPPHLMIVQRRGQHQDFRAIGRRGQPRDGLGRVRAGHQQVEQDQVGRRVQPGQQRPGIVNVRRLADDLHRRLRLQHHAQALAHDGVIVHDQDADRFVCHALTLARPLPLHCN
jgi:hypothetical protein